uniref:non-specific serine/threonine protein kinase n=1 Tax=Lutzomyia longipalpis TaxID=7200 RepID=A0A1B0CE33_LUTLO
MRISNKILEMVTISSHEYDLGWFCALCEVIQRNDLHISQENFQGVLRILLDIQPSLKVEVLLEYFCKCCKIVFSSLKSVPECREKFLTIAQRILQMPSMEPTCVGELLTMMITSGIFPLKQRMEIAKNFLGQQEMRILIAALNDSNAKELFLDQNPREEFVKWICSTTEIFMKFPSHLVAQLILVYVMHAVQVNVTWVEEKKSGKIRVEKYTEATEGIERDLKHKFLYKFIQRAPECPKVLPQKEQISLIHLRQITNHLLILPEDISKDLAAMYFIKRAEVLVLFHSSLKKLSLHGIGDFLDTLECDVVRNVKEVEKCLTQKKHQLSRIHIPNVCEILRNFFREDIHGLTRNCEISGMIKWIYEHFQIFCRHVKGQNEDTYRIYIANCLQCLIYMHKFHADAAESTFGRMCDEFLDKEIKTCIPIYFDVIKTIMQCPYNESLGEWACTEIADLTGRFNKSQDIIEELLDVYEDAAVYFLNGNTEYLNRMLEIITRLTGFSLRNIYRNETATKLIRLIMHYFRNGIVDDQDTFETFIEVLKKFLVFPTFTIQLTVVQAFVEIFASGKDVVDFSHFPREDLAEIFRESADGDRDTAQSRLSLLVQLFQGIFVSCMPARRFVFFEFAQFLQRQNIDEAILRRLHDAQFNEQAEMFTKYVEYCAPDLVELWSRHGKPFDSFPTTVFGCPTRGSFMEKYRQIFPKILIYHGQEKNLQQLEDIPRSQLKELVKKSLPDCIPFILSGHNGQCCYLKDFFVKNFGSIDDVIKQNIPRILMKLFENFWDSEEYERLFGCPRRELEPSEFSLNCQQFENCHKKLSQDFLGTEDDLYSALESREPFAVVKIGMRLKESIYLAPDTDEMLNPILRLIYFSRKLTTLIKNGSQDGITKNFFFSEISRFLLILLCKKSFPVHIAVVLLREFQTFLEGSFEYVLDGVKEQLEFIVDRLTSIIRKTEDDGVKARALSSLTFLFVRKQECLADALKVINNMPKDLEFDAIRRTQNVIVSQNFSNALLTEEEEEDGDNEGGLLCDIEHFLAIKNPNIDSIRYLKKQLSNNPKKLAKMYENINFPHANTILHKLTDIFIKLAQCEDDGVSLEATKCLSEMGFLEFSYANLSQNSPEDGKEDIISYDRNCLTVYRKIMQSLQDLQQDCDVFVSNAASTMLNAFFSDSIGRGIEGMRLKRIFMSVRTKHQVLNINETTVKNHPLNDLFIVEQGDNHDVWILRVVDKLLAIFGNSSLREIAMRKISFAEFLIKTLIELLLSIHHQPINREIQQSVNDFFAKYAEAKATCHPSIHLNKKSIQIMLAICDSIRYYNAVSHKNEENSRKFGRIDLDNFPIADAACYSESYTNALVYAEMWITNQLYSCKKSSKDILASSIREIMIKCYEAIEEKDAAKPFYDLEEMRLWYLNNDSSIGRAFVERDMANALKLEQPCQFEQLLQKSGLHYLTNCLSSEQNFSCAWRMGDWSILDSCDHEPSEAIRENCIDFERDHYSALKNLHKRDENLMCLFTEKCRMDIIELMRKKNPQSTKIFQNHFAMLRQVQQVEDFSVVHFSSNRANAMERLFEKWQWHDEMPHTSFVDKEKILAQRLAILGTDDTAEMVRQKQRTLMNLVREARVTNHDNIAIKYLKYLRSLTLDDEMQSKFLLEDAQMCMSSGYTELAKKLFSSLINDAKYATFLTRITGLWTCGEFFAENMAEDPNVIYQDYFMKAKDELEIYEEQLSTTDLQAIAEERIKIYTAIAKFADKIYTERDKYVNSNEYKEKCHWMKVTQQEVEKLAAQKPPSEELMKELGMKRIVLMKNGKLDELQIKNIHTDRNNYLAIALEFYSYLAAHGDNSDVFISRLVSLWCSNPSNNDVMRILKKGLDDVPSYKFLKVLPQLASRLGYTDLAFTRLLARLLLRCCKEHPYHSLNHLMALQNATYDALDAHEEESGKLLQTNAKQIIEELKRDKKIRSIIRDLYDVSTALIDLANKECEKNAFGNIKLSPNEKIFTIGIRNLFHLPIVDLPIRKDCQYTNITHVTNWPGEYSLMGGINAPKLLKCRCSDGQSRSIILKGNDDLHQDALMQQVFLYINDIFRAEPHLQMLQIRTYRIIPLTKRSGYMEFCANSIPLSSYLTKAHSRYRPHEISFSEGRKIVMDYSPCEPKEKLEKFLELCEKIRPVFHNYFIEEFSNPREWYDKRLTYINTVASTSMVGYILGIGDRHLSNILLDQKTAQIIHIDFGISFERGLIQRTPELVPFRLTRDMVSAMGFLGTDGVFRRSCEMTMEVLRENQATINTILEVLLYDPLCNWSTSQQPAIDASANGSIHVSEQKNASAARALFRVNEKLSGRESNTTVHSVSTQVERLIQQAINPANLSRMFHGWSAFY